MELQASRKQQQVSKSVSETWKKSDSEIEGLQCRKF